MSVTQPGFVAGRAAVRPHLRDLDPTGGFLVACSGGADSLALAACAAAEARSSGVRAGAVVVDHQMQAGSAEVAVNAAEQCRGLGLDPVRVVRVDVDPGAGGPEAGARQARYGALELVRAETGAETILLGHTLDDQAETVLLGLARGSGARALSGMPAVRGALHRPFLGITRATTEAICAELALTPWEDPTNLAPRELSVDTTDATDATDVAGAADAGDTATQWPLRSRVRASLLPAFEQILGPGVTEALARSADMLREDEDFLAGLAWELFNEANLEPHPPIRLDVRTLARGASPVRRRALLRAVTAAGSPPGAITRAHILAIDALVVAWRGQGPVHLPGNLRALREYGTLVLDIPTA